MFKFSELKQIHLEITNNCQASCPMCSRNISGGLENPLIKIQNWSLDDFKTIMTKEVLDQIDGFYFCGNFGDPILNNDLIDMCHYAKETAPIENYVTIHTNGGARSSGWWKELAHALPKNHRVVFALDGLANTHSLYRIGTDFDNIIKNATAFIEEGGNAEWAFIKFKHNEHQVEECRSLSKNLGFNNFTVKNSIRFIGEAKARVLDKSGNITHYLEPATDTPIKFIDKKVIESFKEIVATAEIDCKVLKSKEIYIDAYRHLYPCCHTASVPYMREQTNFHEWGPNVYTIVQSMLTQHQEMIEYLGNMDVTKRSIKEIIDSTEYQTVWQEYWTTKKLLMCVRTCGTGNGIEFSKSKDQFVETPNIY
jgi:MoaA/NifB/PqqE/SkfB family radical SAM enzyme